MSSSIQFLQNLFMLSCDGDWEHSYGFKIDTLDNPGWSVEIDLTQSRIFFNEINISERKDDNDWINLTIKDSKFIGCGDITKLEYIINYFIQIVKKSIKVQRAVYEVYFPISENCKFWAPVLYRLKENGKLIKIKIIE